MSIVDKIQLINLEVEERYYQSPLIEALELYHSLIEANVMQPRENQLNKSGQIPYIVPFNSK